MQITEHFDSDEFEQPAGMDLPREAYPDEWIISRLTPLCAVLETIRAEFDSAVSIVSGYRSVEYNRRLYEARGEVPTDSEHSRGRAADIKIAGVKPTVVHEKILELRAKGAIQIGGLGLYDRWCHVDIRPTPDGRLRRWDNRTNKSDDAGPAPDENPPSVSEEGEGSEGSEEVFLGTVMPLAVVGTIAVLAYARYL